MAKADHTSPSPITERWLKIAADFYPANDKDNDYATARPVPWIRLRGAVVAAGGV